MPLPRVPLIIDVPSIDDTTLIKQNKENIERIYSYLQDVLDAFPNAVGEAIDPTEGDGGDGAITITDPPTDVIYTPGSSLSINGNISGYIDISYTKPRFAVSVAIRYRQVGVINFRTTYDEDSPFRLTNLQAGEEYEIQLAGRAANGSLGPFSLLETILIPTIIEEEDEDEVANLNTVTLEAAYTVAQTDAPIVIATVTERIVVTQIQVVTDNGTSPDVSFRIGFGASNTPTGVGVLLSHPGLGPGLSLSRGAGSGVVGVGVAAESIRITSSVPTSGSIRVIISYYMV